MEAVVADADWAVTEFGRAALGDKRRTERLVALATMVGRRPSAPLPQACDDAAARKGAYRFFENADIAPAAMLASHRQATRERMASVERVLAVQDTTHLDWSVPGATAGRWVHTTLALTPERVPLGVLAQEQWSRAPEDAGKRHTRRERAIADKESHKWLTSLQAVNAAKAACPRTAIVSVGDREADVYDLFLEERVAGVELLVRAAQDRCVVVADTEAQRLRASVAAQPIATTLRVAVPRQQSRPARVAQVAVRWRQVDLRPPTARAAERLPRVTIWVVWAREQDAPPGVPPLDWLLLTTAAVATTADAVERVAWYACRWGIEVFHKVLKSGCAIERRQLGALDHLERCLALYSVVAWRVLSATMLVRELPEVACTAVLEDGEWQALYCQIQQTTTLPSAVPTLAQAIRWVAQLGGYQGRRSDGPPGVTVLWRGFQRLADLTAMYHLFRPPPGQSRCG